VGVVNRLTAVGVEKQKTPGIYPDGGGLSFQVVDGKRGVGKSWFWRYTRCGKTRAMGFGTYPAITLAEARRMRDKWRNVLRHGGDPITERDKPAVPQMTFGGCAEAYLVAHAPEWGRTHRRQWRMTLEVYGRSLWGASGR